MGAGGRAVNINFGTVITGAYMEYCTVTRFYSVAERVFYFAFIPHALHKIFAADARKLAFGAERNRNFTVERRTVIEFAVASAFSVIDFKTPLSV